MAKISYRVDKCNRLNIIVYKYKNFLNFLFYFFVVQKFYFFVICGSEINFKFFYLWK